MVIRDNTTAVCTDCADRMHRRGQAKTKLQRGQHIKVHLPNEWIWAKLRSARHAVLDNMPIADGYAYGDVVEFDPASLEVLRIVESRYRGGIVRYQVPGPTCTEAEFRAVAGPIYKKLEKAGIKCEAYMPGIFGVAYPVTMTEEQAKKTAIDCGAIELLPKP